MTCIVGLEHAGMVWIGGDSAASDGQNVTLREDRKVFRKGDFLFGFTDSFRMGQLLQYALDIPDHDPRKSAMEYLATDFIDSVRACFERGGYMGRDSGDHGRDLGGSWLMGYRGNLYAVYGDFQIEQPYERYIALGSGTSAALGSLYSTGKFTDQRVRVLTALGAAEAHARDVRGPMVVMEQEAGESK